MSANITEYGEIVVAALTETGESANEAVTEVGELILNAASETVSGQKTRLFLILGDLAIQLTGN
jgi:hypothetical protein